MGEMAAALASMGSMGAGSMGTTAGMTAGAMGGSGAGAALGGTVGGGMGAAAGSAAGETAGLFGSGIGEGMLADTAVADVAGDVTAAGGASDAIAAGGNQAALGEHISSNFASGDMIEGSVKTMSDGTMLQAFTGGASDGLPLAEAADDLKLAEAAEQGAGVPTFASGLSEYIPEDPRGFLAQTWDMTKQFGEGIGNRALTDIGYKKGATVGENIGNVGYNAGKYLLMKAYNAQDQEQNIPKPVATAEPGVVPQVSAEDELNRLRNRMNR